MQHKFDKLNYLCALADTAIKSNKLNIDPKPSI